MKLSTIVPSCIMKGVDPNSLGDYVNQFFSLDSKDEITDFFEQLSNKIDSGAINPLDQKKAVGQNKLRNLTGWDKLSEDEKNNFINRIRNIKNLATANDDITKVLTDAKRLIASKTSSGGGGGHTPPGNKNRDVAITEVKILHNSLCSKWGRSSILPSGWEKNINNLEDDDTTKINDVKQQYFNVLKRFDARTEIMEELSKFGASLADTLGISDLKAHFASFKGSAIETKREVKLNNIRNESIAKIENELKGTKGIKLGNNQDFKKKIQNMVDPDQIEIKMKQLLKIISEQKKESKDDESIPTSDSTPKPKWPKVLGIGALVIIPLSLVGLVAFRYYRVKRQRQRRD